MMSGCEASTDQKGFTLIELLVVIVITGVLLGIALINPLQKNNKNLTVAQAQRLMLLMTKARDQAMERNRELGLSIDRGTDYRWWQLGDDMSWQLVKEPPFQPYRLPENLLIRLEVLHYQDPDNTGEAVIPDLVFFSDRQVTPFQLEISGPDDSGFITMGSDGLSDVAIME
ncbi:GspH/FimT family pseudopilin [Endozoicomonas sp. ALB115]|uniref:GspH/FimT family pseudopilin n=1 Tax=Endozoicomonas TaxID=305899 RepID=UPI003BB4F4C2